MKRHLQQPAAQPEPIPTLSREELAIGEDDGSEAEIAAASAEDDVERITEVADIANDAILIVDETPEVGQVEQELVAAVGEMAVAGTDADPEDVIAIPAGGDGLSNEGIISALKSIWDAIVTAIKNMWVGLKHWLTTYFSSLEQNKKHAEKLIERLSGMKGYLANGGAALTSSIVDIFNYGGSSWISFMRETANQDQAFRSFVLNATSTQHALMSAIGQGLEEGYKEFDGLNVDILGGVIDKLGIGLGNYLKRLGMESTKGDRWETKQRMGNMKVECNNFSTNWANDKNNLETKLALLTRVRFSVNQDTNFSDNHKRVMKNDTTPEMLLEAVKERLTFIEALLKFKNDQFKSLEQTLERVEKACTDMLGRIKEDDTEGKAFAKRLMPLTTAYANWATQPTAKLLGVAARHNKFWLSFYEMATNNFQKA